MADEEVLGARSRQVKIPVLVPGGSKSPRPLKAAVERVAAAIPGSRTKWVEGATHNLSAAAAAPMAREFFL